MSDRTLVLVDGENLVARYEQTLKENKLVEARKDVRYEKGQFVWHRRLLRAAPFGTLLRVSYFTTATGDDTKITALRKMISETPAGLERNGMERPETLVPHVFVKQKRSMKNKSVDINLSVEALRHAMAHTVDRIVLLSGDGDYLPVIQEVMRQGVQVWGGAFKSGLSPEIRPAVDGFIELEHAFFAVRD